MLFSKMIRAAALTGLVMSVTIMPSNKNKAPVNKTQSFTYKYDDAIGAIGGGLLGMAGGMWSSLLIGRYFTDKYDGAITYGGGLLGMAIGLWGSLLMGRYFTGKYYPNISKSGYAAARNK